MAAPEVELRLRELLQKCADESEWHSLVFALGEVAETPETVSLLLGYLNLNDLYKTGSLMIALGRIGWDPERIVPRLIGFLDTFEEFHRT